MQAGVIISQSLSIIALLFMMEAFIKGVSRVAKPWSIHFTSRGAGLAFAISFHISASGLVYGLISFLFWSGDTFRGNRRSIIPVVGGIDSLQQLFWWYATQRRHKLGKPPLWCPGGNVFAFVLKTVKRKEKNRKAITALKNLFCPEIPFNIPKSSALPCLLRHWEEKKKCAVPPWKDWAQPAILSYRPLRNLATGMLSCSRYFGYSPARAMLYLCLVACLWVSHLNGDVSCFPCQWCPQNIFTSTVDTSLPSEVDIDSEKKSFRRLVPNSVWTNFELAFWNSRYIWPYDLCKCLLGS